MNKEALIKDRINEENERQREQEKKNRKYLKRKLREEFYFEERTEKEEREFYRDILKKINECKLENKKQPLRELIKIKNIINEYCELLYGKYYSQIYLEENNKNFNVIDYKESIEKVDGIEKIFEMVNDNLSQEEIVTNELKIFLEEVIRSQVIIGELKIPNFFIEDARTKILMNMVGFLTKQVVNGVVFSIFDKEESEILLKKDLIMKEYIKCSEKTNKIYPNNLSLEEEFSLFLLKKIKEPGYLYKKTYNLEGIENHKYFYSQNLHKIYLKSMRGLNFLLEEEKNKMCCFIIENDNSSNKSKFYNSFEERKREIEELLKEFRKYGNTFELEDIRTFKAFYRVLYITNLQKKDSQYRISYYSMAQEALKNKEIELIEDVDIGSKYEENREIVNRSHSYIEILKNRIQLELELCFSSKEKMSYLNEIIEIQEKTIRDLIYKLNPLEASIKIKNLSLNILDIIFN